MVHSLGLKDASASVLEIINLIGTCKEIATHIKRSKIQDQLQISVKQSVSTKVEFSTQYVANSINKVEDITTFSAREQDKNTSKKII